jgi:hypothetical protein
MLFGFEIGWDKRRATRVRGIKGASWEFLWSCKKNQGARTSYSVGALGKGRPVFYIAFTILAMILARGHNAELHSSAKVADLDLRPERPGCSVFLTAKGKLTTKGRERSVDSNLKFHLLNLITVSRIFFLN